MEISYRSPVSLIPYVNNARTHSEDQIDQIAASIKEFGWTNPILIDDGNGVIAGHGRLLAARKLGMDTIPCIRLEDLSEAQRKAYIIADNKLALNAGWDPVLLSLELQNLLAVDFDLSLTGFSEFELEQLLFEENEGLTDPDDIPCAPEPMAQPGDLWACGDHRVYCGDCTVATDVNALLGKVKPHLMVTDPPYGVNYDADWRNKAARTSEGMGNRGIGAGATGKVVNDHNADWSEAWALFPGDVVYVWHAGAKAHIVAESLEKAKFIIRSQIIWNKNNVVIGRGHYHWRHEPCWYAVKKGRKGHWSGDRKQSTIWEIDKPLKSETGHSTQKPVECMKRPIENNSSTGQAVYDPFLGSGTTLIAAEIMGRCCFGIEINPAYVDIAITRWQNFTGQQAERINAGEEGV